MTFQPAFFEISAQLIPVLFLAMVVEDKLRSGPDDVAWERVVRSFALVLLAAGEAACLAVVAGSIAGSVSTGRTVSLALLLAGLLMVSSAIGREFVSGRRRAELVWHGGAVLTFAGLVAWLALAIAG